MVLIPVKIGAKKGEQMETIINQFRDYQIDCLTSHCDIVCDSEIEQIIVQFIKDTADCFIKEDKNK